MTVSLKLFIHARLQSRKRNDFELIAELPSKLRIILP
jgi:hypothetical protein